MRVKRGGDGADGGGVAAWEDGREDGRKGGGGIEEERGPGACDW